MKISREEEANLPNFSSHQEAREYFKNKYGSSRFVMTDSDVIDGRDIYFYYLILDPKAYKDGQKKLLEDGYVTGFEYFHSHQSIEIFEDGDIHIIH